MYMPKLARFTSRDPMGANGTAVLGRSSGYAFKGIERSWRKFSIEATAKGQWPDGTSG